MISVDKKAKINNLKLLNHVQNQVSLSKAKIQSTWWPIFRDAQSEALMAKGGFPQFKCQNNIYVTEFCTIFVMTIPQVDEGSDLPVGKRLLLWSMMSRNS